ncbi:hypothetical protein TRFO_08224 [Tritrichomonas foetus]|uniref:Inner centromere protein ARK-binding domain-containing protein n=1 Tax=Tritrichomonas foetus TaxID=1144522 RepID=A0A1J4JLD0_9EUKA|nr:hypothetical protein TRFO_08224 [Tritrichomonas foetus]|eukprot:OHS99902.1 hypothetical protein TRFO_08224 [Tritrichomonas foetus]
MQVQETINDLQETLEQQYLIYKTNQDLHFDWLNSVKFQLNVYDQSNGENIKVHESSSPTDTEEIHHNQTIQHKNVLDSYKKQINPGNNHYKSAAQQKSLKTLPPPIPTSNAKRLRPPPSPLSPFQKAEEDEEEDFTNQDSQFSSNITPFSISSLKSSKPTKSKKIPSKLPAQKMSSNNLAKSSPSPVMMPLSRCCTSPAFNVTLTGSQSIKFVDNDSLLSTSQSSFNSDSDFYSSNANVDNEDDEYEEQIKLCQTMPSQHVPFTVSGNYSELTTSASCFQAQWQQMVNEKKRATLGPKTMPGTLFEFDRVPDSYEITDSEEEHLNFFSSDDDEIHDDNPFEIHGKMIPLWARQENINKQLRKQQKVDPDSVFVGLSKHCYVSQVFGADKRPSLANEITWDELDECDEIILS